MKCRLRAFRYLLLVFVGVFSLNAIGQPVLPGLAGAADGGLVLLTWVCQYDGVKTVAVRRSSDSLFNYSIIGYVKKTDKGVQVFADGHPLVGSNYYKLNIVFNSGLNWSSNSCRVVVDSAQMVVKTTVPSNDSLQRFITIEETAQQPARPVAEEGNQELGEGSRKLTVSFGADTTSRHAAQPAPVVTHRKITLSFPDPDMERATFIQSEYLAVNKLNGHLTITLPNDLSRHQYSIKFYNASGKMVLEVPMMRAAVSILDKRNFQRRGTYKFVLKKDGVVLESGYVTINL